MLHLCLLIDIDITSVCISVICEHAFLCAILYNMVTVK